MKTYCCNARLWLVWVLLGLTTALQAAPLARPVPTAPQVSARSYLLQDFDSGKVIAEKNADQPMEPASLTKLMTAYVVFQELKAGRIHLDEEVLISEKAWRTEGSRMFVEVGKRVPVELLIKGMIVQSGNDATVALAEHVAGSEEAFVSLMNQYARQLGMNQTTFKDASGLPAEGHLTTARDMARLAAAIIREFPDYYRWFAIREMTYNKIRQSNRNTLLFRDPSVDGLKTGHTSTAGYCLVSSARKDGMRLISVVMGSRSEKARADDSQRLLGYGFRFFETRKLYEPGEKISEVRVWKGEKDQLALTVDAPVWVTIPRGSYGLLQVSMALSEPLLAPVHQGQAVGQLNVTLGDQPVVERPLQAAESIAEGSLWKRLGDGASLWLEGWLGGEND